MPIARPTRAKTKRKSDSAAALARALKFERSGRNYYARAAGYAADPFAAAVLSLLKSFEEQHIRDIVAISRSVQEEGSFPSISTAPSDARMKLFAREMRRIRKEKFISGESPDVMRKALGVEAEAREMYRRMAAEASSPQERKFFGLLCNEEERHFELLYEYLDFLEERGLRMQDG